MSKTVKQHFQPIATCAQSIVHPEVDNEESTRIKVCHKRIMHPEVDNEEGGIVDTYKIL